MKDSLALKRTVVGHSPVQATGANTSTKCTGMKRKRHMCALCKAVKENLSGRRGFKNTCRLLTGLMTSSWLHLLPLGYLLPHTLQMHLRLQLSHSNLLLLCCQPLLSPRHQHPKVALQSLPQRWLNFTPALKRVVVQSSPERTSSIDI